MHGGGQQIPVPPPPIEMPKFPDFEPIQFPEMTFPDFPEFPTFDPNAGAAKARREQEVRDLRQIEQRRKGYRSTLLTGGTGDDTQPALNRPGLLAS